MRRFIAVCLVLGCAVGVYARSGDNRPVGADPVRTYPVQVEDSQVIHFSTRIVANTDTNIVGDHFVFYGSTGAPGGMIWPGGINYSTAPTESQGGRTYIGFQAICDGTQTAISGTTRLYWGLDGGVSTTTSPYLTAGQWWPPADWPVVFQSTITVRSTAAYTLGGVIITEKKR